MPGRSLAECPVALLLAERCQPRFHGSGAQCGFRRAGLSRSDCSQRELCPNPIGSGTSCRRLVTGSVGDSKTVRRAFSMTPTTSPPGGLAFAKPASAAAEAASDSTRALARSRRSKGRLTRSSAKRSAIRRTRGAFRRWAPPLGVDSSPRVADNLWIGIGAFAIQVVVPPS